jgi:hypothetical protein
MGLVKVERVSGHMIFTDACQSLDLFYSIGSHTEAIGVNYSHSVLLMFGFVITGIQLYRHTFGQCSALRVRSILICITLRYIGFM